MIHNFQRTLGRSGIRVSALGMGCWAIGGPFTGFGGLPVGWGEVDDQASLEALQVALDHGVNFFDTADVYGTGHSERLLGQAFKGIRDKVVIATKFGGVYDEQKRDMYDFDGTPAYMRKAIEASLKRLDTDYIDLYQLHIKDYDKVLAKDTMAELEKLVDEGKIRGYAWSTDDYDRAAIFAKGLHCIAVQQQLNIFVGNEKILSLCEERNLASVNRGPLAMGLLTGKFKKEIELPANDVRIINENMGDPYYAYFKGKKPLPELMNKLDAVKEILKSNGRTLAQGSLAWVWAKSGKTVPIPGFKTAKQVKENAKALDFGPLTKRQMHEIENLVHK
jgi:aryl-alcohol dehydrogenase-like predicted oxidoreductase